MVNVKSGFSQGEGPMVIGSVGRAITAVAIFALTRISPVAANTSIYNATLAEANQTTPEISTKQLRDVLADDSVVVFDTRTRAEFDAGHIPGARNLNVPASAQVAEIAQLLSGDKSKALVLYCNGPYCQASRRLAEQLVAAGFTNVRRYQLGIPVWRALGGPTEIELGGITRVFKIDQSAVFIDGRSLHEFNKGSLPGAQNMPADELAAGRLKKLPLPEDDFNRRIILFGQNGTQARKLADVLSKRPWHNVVYFGGTFDDLAAATRDK
jgi:rhodanese-related sulfurtransferase